MNNTITHYQTSFRVVDADGTALKRLRANVHGWVCDKERSATILREKVGDFFFRCDWAALPKTHSSVRTDTFLSPEGEAWALQYRELDGELGRKRFWQSDVGLKKEVGHVVVSIRISYAWNEEDLSVIRPEPFVSVPWLVRYLLRNNTVYSGRPEFRLIETPIRFDKGGTGKALADFIKSPERRYPLVVFHGDAPDMVAEAQLLANSLTGKCQVVVVAGNQELAEELRHYLGEAYWITLGYFRVYFPFHRRLNNPERHRWYNIRRPDYPELRQGLMHGLLRNHSLLEPGAVESVADVARLIGREKLLKLKVQDPEQQKELEEVFGLYAELEKERDHYKGESETYASDVDRLEGQIKALEWRCKDYQSRLDATNGDRAGETVAEIMPTLPKSLAEVTEMAGRALPRLVITNSALKTAQDYQECKCVAEAWEMLRHLSETLHPLKFEGAEKDLVGKFKAKSGYDLAMSEGKMTQDDTSLMRLRKLQHDGKEFDITPHVKHGTVEPKSVRIYFAFDEERKKIVVGHVGKHIPNYTTKKM